MLHDGGEITGGGVRDHELTFVAGPVLEGDGVVAEFADATEFHSHGRQLIEDFGEMLLAPGAAFRPHRR